MVRNYKRTTQQQAWSVDALTKAVDAVRNNQESVRGAAKKFNIPRPTLQRHLKNTVQAPGKLGRFRPVFHSIFEEQLTQHCLDMQKRFYGLSHFECQTVPKTSIRVSSEEPAGTSFLENREDGRRGLDVMFPQAPS